MDKIIDLEGRRYPFRGRTPEIGDVIAGFIVRRVTDGVVYVGYEETKAERRAVDKWWAGRLAR